MATRQGAGDEDRLPESIDEYVRQSLLYVPAVARAYRGMGLDYEDLIAAGNLGLVEAALRFDPTRNVKFLTYADWWIRKMIRDALAEEFGPVRIPRHQQARLRRLQTSRGLLRSHRGEEPDRDDLARDVGLARSDVEWLLQCAANSVSIEQPVGSGDERTLKELLSVHDTDCPQCSNVRRDLAEHLHRHLSSLQDRERQVLSLRFGFVNQTPLSLREAGRKLGISRESVRKVETRALRKLRSRMVGASRSAGGQTRLEMIS